ncbi:MAG: BON domain-containing protein [Limisphaerales bacterium]
MKVKEHITGGLGVLAAIALIAGCNRDSNSSPAGGAADSHSESSGQDANAPRSSQLDARSRHDYPADANGSAPRAPDNTGVNVRDRSETALTPGDQGSSTADREITRRVRRALTANDQLSTTAKNIKIITTNGRVTLRGPVKDEQEKRQIDLVVLQSGAIVVDDQLEPKTVNQ